ncbi:MAG: hypothetical protein IJA08_06070 [Clostridia bacterium]|nr:hypothetical protein [Clostridia bacterium]
MKKFLAMTLAITTLILSLGVFTVSADPVSYEIEGNLFTNGSFESGRDGWGTESPTLSWYNGGAHTGTGTTSIQWGTGHALYQDVTLQEDKTYVLSAWLKLDESATAGTSGAAVAFFIMGDQMTELSGYQRWNHDLGVTLEKGVWKQVTWEINTNNLSTPTAILKVGFNGQTGVKVWVDDFFIGEAPKPTNGVVLTNATWSVTSSHNTLSTLKWNSEGITIDYAKETADGYSDPVRLYLGANTVAGPLPLSADAWSKLSFETSIVPGSGTALISVNTTTAPIISMCLAPQSGNRAPTDFDITVTYTPDEGEPVVSTLKVRFIMGGMSVSLSDGVTTINESDALVNGTYTPTVTFYNKRLGWNRYMIISVVMTNGRVSDAVISMGNILEQGWSRSLATTFDDTLTITDAEISQVKTYIWFQGDGSTAAKPVWFMKPIVDPVVIG